MKIQDIIFVLMFLILIYRSQSRISAGLGILCFIFSIPLFAMWVFFTADRLVWYGAGFIFLSAIQMLITKNKS